MKLEWGKKVCCPACASPFYSMQKTSLVCPKCANKFKITELTSKKSLNIAMDETAEADERIALSDFDLADDDADIDFVDEDENLSEDDVISDIKLVDEE